MKSGYARFEVFRKYKETFPVYIGLIAFNISIWVFVLAMGHNYPDFISLGLLAYVFGLRHAVDADHIAAIDNTTRKLLHEGKRPVSVGLYFSLGHSTVVFLLTLGIVIAMKVFEASLPHMEGIGSFIGTTVSASFLYLIAWLNFRILREIWKVSVRIRKGNAEQDSLSSIQLENLLTHRGFVNRLLKHVVRMVSQSWQMYFIGFLFGLGFETASEVALLGLSSSVTSHGMPIASVLLLPALFAAGMSLVDTTDGILMLYAYDFAFRDPTRKIVYNLIVTSVSVFIAFGIGTVEWLQVIPSYVSKVRFMWWINRINLGSAGYFVIGLFLVSWMIEWIVYQFRRSRLTNEEKVDF